MLDIALQAISIEKRWALSNKYSSLYKSLRLSSTLPSEQHIIYAVDTIIECLDMFSIFIVVKYNKHTHPNHYYYTWSLTVAQIRGEKTQRDNIQHNIQHTHKKKRLSCLLFNNFSVVNQYRRLMIPAIMLSDGAQWYGLNGNFETNSC